MATLMLENDTGLRFMQRMLGFKLSVLETYVAQTMVAHNGGGYGTVNEARDAHQSIVGASRGRSKARTAVANSRSRSPLVEGILGGANARMSGSLLPSGYPGRVLECLAFEAQVG